MKVLNYTTSYLAIIILALISIWAGIFYYAMLDEIYDSIDDGLDNQKGLVLQKLKLDSTILLNSDFEERDYAINEISSSAMMTKKDVYIDTMMYMQNEEDFEPVRLLTTTFQHRNKNYKMQVMTSMVEEDDLVSEFLYALIWLYAGLIATMFLLNKFLMKRIWSPFYHLLKQLKDFRIEKPAIDVKPTRIEEFSLLNEAVQKMIKSTTDAYTSQKHFIENASHELQTPLAISINKLESLAETATLSSNESKLLVSALDNLERLTRLNKSLVLLSKIENRQFGSEEIVNINLVTKKILDDFSDQVDYSKIQLQLDEEAACFVTMNADLANVLVTNLVKNAILHNHPNGMINIKISKNSFTIANSSSGIPLNEGNLFRRFNKDVESRSSTGLGLAIVKAIAELFHFNIQYQHTDMHIIIIDFNL